MLIFNIKGKGKCKSILVGFYHEAHCIKACTSGWGPWWKKEIERVFKFQMCFILRLFRAGAVGEVRKQSWGAAGREDTVKVDVHLTRNTLPISSAYVATKCKWVPEKSNWWGLNAIKITQSFCRSQKLLHWTQLKVKVQTNNWHWALQGERAGRKALPKHPCLSDPPNFPR